MCAGEEVERSNDMPICVYAEPPVGEDGGSANYMADAILYARVSYGCVPCSQDFQLECTIERVNETIELTTRAHWIESTEPCDASCQLATAACETTEPVPAGTFEVVYGDAPGQDLEIPANDPDAEPLCFE